MEARLDALTEFVGMPAVWDPFSPSLQQEVQNVKTMLLKAIGRLMVGETRLDKLDAPRWYQFWRWDWGKIGRWMLVPEPQSENGAHQ